jgi:uncharacterized protein involved in outer membrane biogenesis
MVLLLLPLLLAGLAWWQKDAIIGVVISRINERLATPVRVDKIDLTFWATFPHLAVQLDSVIIQESDHEHLARMASLGQVRFGFSPWAVFKGTYQVEFIEVHGGNIHMKNLGNGLTNYAILKPSTDTAQGQTAFALKHVWLTNLRYRFTDVADGGARVALVLPQGVASLSTKDGLTTVHLETQGAVLQRLVVGNTSLADGLAIALNQTMEIHAGQELRFLPSTARLGQADFDLAGRVGLEQRLGTYHFSIQNKGSSLAALSVLLPATARKELDKYQTQGQVYFKGEVEATERGQKYPHIQASFGTKKARFTHGGYGMDFNNVSLTGSLALPEGQTLEQAQLSIKNMSGTVAGRPFKAELLLTNLDKPQAKGFVQARLPLALFATSLQETGITEPTGNVGIDVQFVTHAQARPEAEGALALDSVGFKAGNRHLAFTHWSGKLALKSEVLTAEALRGSIGRSDLAIEGRIEHLLGFLAGTKPKLGLQVDLQSQFMDLDELLLVGTLAPQKVAAAAKAGADQAYKLDIAPGLRLHAACNVKQLRFRRFSPRNVRGQIDISGQQVALESIVFQEVGGSFEVSGTLDARKDPMQVDMLYHVDGARMDSLFYVLEDFNQKTLTSKQIQGQLSAKGNASFALGRDLNLHSKTLVAASEVSITNGALLYFEPAQALGRFINKEDLKYLQFSALENTFSIENEVLTIPEMDIRSNVFRCYVRGTHTFRQDMDYHLRIPTKYVRKSSLQASTHELGGNLMLTLRGRVPNLRVGYDCVAVKDKIKNDFKEEKQNFLNIFRRKPKVVEQAPEPTEEEPAKEEQKFLDLD